MLFACTAESLRFRGENVVEVSLPTKITSILPHENYAIRYTIQLIQHNIKSIKRKKL